MTTKAPSPVEPAEGTTLASIAYAAVSGIPAAEPHDCDRLGYNVWRWLSTGTDSLEEAVKTAGARLKISEEDAVGRIRAYLRDRKSVV